MRNILYFGCFPHMFLFYQYGHQLTQYYLCIVCCLGVFVIRLPQISSLSQRAPLQERSIQGCRRTKNNTVRSLDDQWVKLLTSKSSIKLIYHFGKETHVHVLGMIRADDTLERKIEPRGPLVHLLE